MNAMKAQMKTFYFTGTGNSLQVARNVGSGGELVSIPRFLREQSGATERVTVSADALGLVFPTHWLAVPSLVVELLEQVRLDTDYLFIIATRGNASLTLKSHLLQAAQKNGHAVSYFNTISMPDNYLPLCDMAKEKQRFTSDALSQKIERMASDVRARKCNVSGLAALSFLRPVLVSRAGRQLSDFSQRLSTDESCIRCGVCAQVCSAKSIRLIDGVPVYSSTCNACLACVHNCPVGAKHMRSEKTPERYVNPTVSTADIIQGNG